jgi:restriction endonuclease Mrr
MSKRGQTVGMHAAEHLAEIQKHIGRMPDIVFVNTATFPEDLLLKYQAEGDHPILNNCVGDICRIEARPFASQEKIILSDGDKIKRSLIRHDSGILAEALLSILNLQK